MTLVHIHLMGKLGVSSSFAFVGKYVNMEAIHQAVPNIAAHAIISADPVSSFAGTGSPKTHITGALIIQVYL
jgi:hypothetical protein